MSLFARAEYTERPGNQLASIPIEAGETIFDGALVRINPSTGRAANWQDPTTPSLTIFMGIARVTDSVTEDLSGGESRTGDTAGTQLIHVDISGVILKAISVTDATEANLGRRVYASDENTFTVTATPGNHAVGFSTRFYGADPDVAGNFIVDVHLFSAEAARMEIII